VVVAGVPVAAGAVSAGAAGVAVAPLLSAGAGVAGAIGVALVEGVVVVLSDGAGVAGVAGAVTAGVDGVVSTPVGISVRPAKTKYAITISATTIMPPIIHPADVLLSRR
jgi:hypothetical protein